MLFAESIKLTRWDFPKILHSYEISGLICFDLSIDFFCFFHNNLFTAFHREIIFPYFRTSIKINAFIFYFSFLSHCKYIGSGYGQTVCDGGSCWYAWIGYHRTSLHRGAGLSLIAGFINRECSSEIIPLADAGIARTRVLHTDPTIPWLNVPGASFFSFVILLNVFVLLCDYFHFWHFMANDIPDKPNEFPCNSNSRLFGIFTRLDQGRVSTT